LVQVANRHDSALHSGAGACHVADVPLLLLPMQLLLHDNEAQQQLAASLLAHEAAGDAAAAVGSQHVSMTARTSCTSLEGSVLAAYNSAAWELLHEVLLPVAILLLGVGFSVAALWVAVAAFVP
jgi:hypothetical protein